MTITHWTQTLNLTLGTWTENETKTSTEIFSWARQCPKGKQQNYSKIGKKE